MTANHSATASHAWEFLRRSVPLATWLAIAMSAACNGGPPPPARETMVQRRVAIADFLEPDSPTGDAPETRSRRRTDFSVRTEVPEDALLTLRGFAVRPNEGHFQPDYAEFVVKADGKLLFSRRLKLQKSPHRFADTIDLGELAGRDVDFEFSVGGLRNPGAAHWRRVLLEQNAPVLRQPASSGPNLLFVVVDTLRADHCGLYGHELDTTPFLDSFARSATVYDRAVSQAPWTLPSVSTLLTGIDPTRHGVIAGTEVLSWRYRTIAEALQEAGFSSFGVSANMLISPNKNFDQGLEEMVVLRNAAAEAVNGAVLDLVDRCAGYRWFGYVHYMDPHTPYDAPVPAGVAFVDPDYGGVFLDPKAVDRLAFTVNFGLDPLFPVDAADRAYLGGRYDGDILHWDRAFGELIGQLDRRGELDRTIVIVTSDHGEELLDHGMVKHGPQLYQESVHVPLVVRRAGGEAGGGRVAELFELRSVPALALDLLGMDPGSFPTHRGAGPDRTPTAFSFAAPAVEPNRPWPRRRIASLISDRWKLIRWFTADRTELFDLASDPGELRNLADVEPELARRLGAALDERLAGATLDKHAGDSSADELEELRALGYIQ